MLFRSLVLLLAEHHFQWLLVSADLSILIILLCWVTNSHPLLSQPIKLLGRSLVSSFSKVTVSTSSGAPQNTNSDGQQVDIACHSILSHICTTAPFFPKISKADMDSLPARCIPSEQNVSQFIVDACSPCHN